MPSAHHGNMPGAGFQGGPGILGRKGAHPYNDNHFSVPVDIQGLVGDTVDKCAPEQMLILPGNGSGRADAVVNRQDYSRAGYSAGFSVPGDAGPVAAVMLFNLLGRMPG